MAFLLSSLYRLSGLNGDIDQGNQYRYGTHKLAYRPNFYNVHNATVYRKEKILHDVFEARFLADCRLISKYEVADTLIHASWFPDKNQPIGP